MSDSDSDTDLYDNLVVPDSWKEGFFDKCTPVTQSAYGEYGTSVLDEEELETFKSIFCFTLQEKTHFIFAMVYLSKDGNIFFRFSNEDMSILLEMDKETVEKIHEILTSYEGFDGEFNKYITDYFNANQSHEELHEM